MRGTPRWRRIGLANLVLLGLAGCARRGTPVDLLRATDRLAESSAAGLGAKWVASQVGRTVRIDDVVKKTLPASPPSRLRYALDVPHGARLSLSCGIPEERHDQPGVEFLVKVRRGGREETAWSLLLDPARREGHRGWVAADVDLSRHGGREIELILETRGFEEGGHRAAYWGAPAISAAGREAPLVLVYLVDTLRADHTGPYGYHRKTTPALDAFARDAVVFESAVAQSSWTKPSVASIFTSQLPGRHRAVQLRDPLDPALVTLAERLEAGGFATGAAIANAVIYSAGVNFEQGFDSFAGLHGPADRPNKLVDAADVVDAGLAWIDARRGFPTFLYVHTTDPHTPYQPPPPYDRMFEPHPSPGHPAADPHTDYKEPGDLERLIAQYDGDVAYGDREFGRLLRELKARGLYEGALVIFLADHGEEFLDHGSFLHGQSVFDELIRIPLIVKLPGGRHAGTRVAQQVQTVDVLPTILQETGLSAPEPPAVVGQPLQAVIAGGAPEPPAVSEISHRGLVAHGARTSRDKYVRRFSPQDDELYFDLARDPKERVNLLGENAERVRLLRAGVEAAMAPNPFRHAVRLAGAGEYVLHLRTGGWIEGVEAVGLAPGERHETVATGRGLALTVRPRSGQPREVSFGTRPVGAPVWLTGTKDGRPLRPEDVFIARDGRHPRAVPFTLPGIEPQSDDEAGTANPFVPPDVDRPGVHVWLVLTPGREVLDLDKETRGRLQALGYLGN